MVGWFWSRAVQGTMLPSSCSGLGSTFWLGSSSKFGVRNYRCWFCSCNLGIQLWIWTDDNSSHGIHHANLNLVLREWLCVSFLANFFSGCSKRFVNAEWCYSFCLICWVHLNELPCITGDCFKKTPVFLVISLQSLVVLLLHKVFDILWHMFRSKKFDVRMSLICSFVTMFD